MSLRVDPKNINPLMTTDTELTAGLATKYDASNPLGFETPSQLNTRDTNNRARGNHTGTQLASTISDIDSTIRGTILSGLTTSNAVAVATDNILTAIGKLQGQVDNINSTFAATVRATVLTGLSLTSGIDIVAADTVISALGKLQKNLTDAKAASQTALNLKANLAGGNTFTGNQNINSGSLNIGGTTVQSSGEWNVAAGTYTDPDSGTLYDAKFGGPNRGINVRGISYFLDQVGLGAQTPVASAKMEISSTTQGFLLPRMTQAQREAISSPAQSLIVFDTTTNSYYYHDNNNWVSLTGSITKRNSTTLNNSSNVTLVSVNDLAIPVVNGKFYEFEAYMLFRSANTNTGIALTIGATTATGSINGMVNIPIGNDGTAGQFQGQITALGDLVVGTGVQATGVDYIARITGLFNCTTSGTIYPQFRSELNGTQVTVQPNSIFKVKEI